MHNRSLLLACGLLVGAVAFGGCGDDDEDSATGGTGGTGNTGNTGNEGGSGATGNAGGAGATGGGGAGATGGGGEGGSPAAPTCAEYCAAIQTNCTGDNAQYSSAENCEAYCATWEPGADGDTAGNTVGCHAYHADASAGAGADTHCIHAGPGGGTMCGATPCDDFCEAAVELCSAVWTDKAECMTDCEAFPTDDPYNAAATGGDQFACRLYHLTVASTTPDPHCEHIGPTPADPDGFPCSNP